MDINKYSFLWILKEAPPGSYQRQALQKEILERTCIFVQRRYREKARRRADASAKVFHFIPKVLQQSIAKSLYASAPLYQRDSGLRCDPETKSFYGTFESAFTVGHLNDMEKSYDLRRRRHCNG